MTIKIPKEFDLSGQSYDIKDELKIRKILEKNTTWEYMFVKNDDPFAYDIMGFKYDVYPDGKYKKNCLGFVEIERKYDDGWIEKWAEISFLRRKVTKCERGVDNKFIGWVDELKEHGDITYYLKFKNDYTDCFCVNIKNLWENGYCSGRSNNTYNGTFWVLKKESEYIKYGIENCLEYIQEGLNP